MKLYEIGNELEAIYLELVENGGELTPGLEEALGSLRLAFAEKVEKTALAVRTLQAEADAIESEQRRLAGMVKSRRNAAVRLKEYLMREMERAGARRVEGQLVTVRIQANSRPTLEWLRDPNDLLPEYQYITIRPNSQKAYEDYVAGVELPEGWKVQLGEHLRIA